MKRSLVLLVVAAVLVSACGGADRAGTLVVPTRVGPAPLEDRVICFDWPSGTVAKACAVGMKGPGGGRVFFDALSVQPWGRFLEVAPQNWGPTLVDCSSCGAATEAPYNVSKQTSDGGSDLEGYYPCRDSDRAALLPGEAGETLWDIGAGKRNTEVLSATPECADGSVSAVTLATGYRGGGLSDWYLPSGGELTELCKYEGRDAIGGFEAKKYVSSTVGPKDYSIPADDPGTFENVGFPNFFGVDFASDPLCARTDVSQLTQTDSDIYVAYPQSAVRPIRAFS